MGADVICIILQAIFAPNRSNCLSWLTIVANLPFPPESLQGLL